MIVWREDVLKKIREEVKMKAEDVNAALADGIREECPVDTGFMKSTIGHSKEKVWCWADYAKFVNYGTRYMAPRYFFERGIARALETIRKILGARIT